MKNIAIILLLTCCLAACKSSKRVAEKKSSPSEVMETITSDNEKPLNSATDSKINSIVDYAIQFDGVKYKYGGTTKKGMDCSGLITTAFKSEDVLLPRTTDDLASTGNSIELNEVQKGDLLFFATRKNSRKINHVGLVIDTRPGYVEFIHATTSLGVIVSSLADQFWFFAFVEARRIL